MIRNIFILFSTFLCLECAIIPALAIPRLAVIAENKDARPPSDILTAQLSESKDYVILERDEIVKIFREQQITLEGLAEHSDLSRLTGADGLILLRPMEKGNQRLLVSRIVAVHPGVVLDTLSCPLPCTDYDAWASLISTRVKQLSPKFEVLARDATAVSILNIRAEYEAETTKSHERSLNKLLFTRLTQEPRMFVLERQNLDKLDWEKKLSLKSEDKFWTAGYILEGSFSEVNTNSIAVNVKLLAPDGTRITNIVNTGAASSVESIVDQTAIRILKALQIAPSSVLWSPKDEAQRYYQEAIWANRWKLYPESISAIESSWALGNQTEKAAFQRLQCYLQSLSAQQAGGNLTFLISNERLQHYLQSLSAQNEAPLVIKRLLELYLEYRRMFPQKSLKLAPYIERADELRWLPYSLDNDSERAHYYRDVINAASILLQKERQYPNWDWQYHDVLVDIRSLILAVCREVDIQAEKEQITSPIKDFIIKQGYYWYDNPQDYVAALYRSLEGRNGSRGTMFHAISGYKNWPYLLFGWPPDARQTFFHWPDKILREFDRYGPEFNRGLCHSTNSVNRLIGHYCELKWATTNLVTITENMDHLMDDLWESRDVILAPNSRFALFLMQNNINGPDSDFYNYYHYYLETFRLWKEKAVFLPSGVQAQYNDKILAFHRKYLLYAINARKIPFGWFRPVFEEHLNMSLEEGQLFYDAHLNNPTSAPDDIRSMFYVVYKSKKAPISNQARLTTNAFQIKMNHDSLTTAMINYLTGERDASKTPTPTITTSPYPSLVVAQYYSLPGKIQNIAFANRTIWAALPDRLLVLDGNTFFNTVVCSIAWPEVQYAGANLFLDTGAEITRYALDNRLLKKWPKPNGEKDFRFYIFNGALYFYKNGLIIRMDLQTGNSSVIASGRRKPELTLLDGTGFNVDRLFGSSDTLFALICHGPRGCGVYAFDQASTNWGLIENFARNSKVPAGLDHDSHSDFGWGASHLIVKPCKDGTLFFDALGGTGVELWSTKTRDKQLLFGPKYDEYGLIYDECKSKWTIPASFDSPSKMAEYDGNNLYLLTPPKYDDYQVLLWFFEKDRETGVPIQLNFLTNNASRVAEIIQNPSPRAIIEVYSLSPNPFHVNYSANFILTGCSRGLIMAMKNATGFWFLPFEDIRRYITQNNVLMEQKAEVAHVTSSPARFKLEGRYDRCAPEQGKSCTVWWKYEGASKQLEMAWIPPGEFMTGSPPSENERDENETQHKVIITKGFWMGKYEVTQKQWVRLMRTNPSQFRGPELPVDSVTWNDCQKFIRKLNALISVLSSTNQSLRFDLPTEAEWEYACRAGTTNRFYTGDSVSDLDRAGWYSGNSGGATHPVGQKQPNAWGLYDMHGNVQEWCADWYTKYESVAVHDPKGIKSGNGRVLRSSNNTFSPKDCRSASRSVANPDAQSSGYGFRIVLYP